MRSSNASRSMDAATVDGATASGEADQVDDEEYWMIAQERNALVAKLAVELPRLYIKEGRKRAIDSYKPKVISRKEYNESRKRDFRQGKKEAPKVGVPSDVPDDDISMAMLQEHPNAFMRDYRMNAFEKGTLKYLHSGLWSYEFIRCIDISGLAVGDEGFSELCAGIGGRCPVETLVLTGNNITDRGLEVFSGVCRSLSKLHHLILNDNKFGDRGVAALFHPHRYPSALRLVNLSKNRLQVKSAYFIGLMFLKERSAALEELILGIKIGNTTLGDNFLRVLGGMLLAPGARPLRRLDIGDFGMGLLGLDVIITMLISSPHLEELNISRNYIPPFGRRLLYRALRVNRSLLCFRGSYCGFEPHDEKRLKELGFLQARPCGAPIANVVTSMNSTPQYNENKCSFKRPELAPLSWEECVELSCICLRTSHACAHHLKTVMQGISGNEVPPPPTDTKLFAGSARGGLTVLQQTSLYGAKAIRATPLKEEMEKLDYLFERLAPQPFAEAMSLLQCELQDAVARSDLTSPWDLGVKHGILPGLTSDFQGLFHASSPSKITPDLFKDSDLDDKNADTIVLFYDKKPLVLFKLVSPDVFVLERWLDYLKVLYLDKYKSGITGIDVEFASQMILFYKCYDAVKLIKDAIDTSIVSVFDEYHLAKLLRSTSAEVSTDAEGEWCHILQSVGVNILPVVPYFPWRKKHRGATPHSQMGPTPPKSREVLEHEKSLDDSIEGGDSALTQMQEDAGGGSRPSTMSPSRPGTQASKALSGSKKVVQANTVRKVTGHAFLWTHRQMLFSDNRDINAEIASMALEDYNSSILRAIKVAEELISTNLIGSRIDLGILSQEMLPASTSYIYQCLTGALRPVTKEISKAQQAIDIINERRNLKKASRGGQRVTGSRFTLLADPPGSRGSSAQRPRSGTNMNENGSQAVTPTKPTESITPPVVKSKKSRSSPKHKARAGKNDGSSVPNALNRKDPDEEAKQRGSPPASQEVAKSSFLPPLLASLFGMKK